MAQFCGGETAYDSIWGSIKCIWREEGILGFLQGVTARLLAESLQVLIVNALVYVTDRYVLGKNRDPGLSTVSSLACSMAATEVTYPIQVAATAMAGNTSGLALCSEPLTPR